MDAAREPVSFISFYARSDSPLPENVPSFFQLSRIQPPRFRRSDNSASIGQLRVFIQPRKGRLHRENGLQLPSTPMRHFSDKNATFYKHSNTYVSECTSFILHTFFIPVNAQLLLMKASFFSRLSAFPSSSPSSILSSVTRISRLEYNR